MNRLEKIRQERIDHKVVGVIASGSLGVLRVLPPGNQVQRLRGKIEKSSSKPQIPNNTPATKKPYRGHDLRGG